MYINEKVNRSRARYGSLYNNKGEINMIYILTHEFTMLEQTEGLMQNLSLTTPIEITTSNNIPQKDSGVTLMPLEKLEFATVCKERVFARCTKLDGTLANLSVVSIKTPVNCGSGARSRYHVGDVFYTAASIPPEGSLKADGTAISRQTYKELFDVIGVSYGEGDGEATFNLPDLRGEFIRCFDDGKGVDNDRILGSNQGFCMESHNHKLPTNTGLSGSQWAIPDELWKMCIANEIPSTNPPTPALTYRGSTEGTFGNETRPRNVALLACIQSR